MWLSTLVTFRIVAETDDVAVGAFNEHLAHAPGFCVWRGKYLCAGVLYHLVVLVDIVNDDRDPCRRAALIALAKEYLDRPIVESGKGRRVVPRPTVREFQLVPKISHTRRYIRRIKDRYCFVEFHMTEGKSESTRCASEIESLGDERAG